MGDVRWKLGRSTPFSPSLPPVSSLEAVFLHEPPRNICRAVSVAHPGAVARMACGLTPLHLTCSTRPHLTVLSLALSALGLQSKQTLAFNPCSSPKTAEMKKLAKSSSKSPTWLVNMSKNRYRKIYPRGTSPRNGCGLTMQAK